MKHDIIKTDNYLLVVDENDIPKGNWHLKNDVMITRGHLIDENCKKIIAHLPLNGSPILEGVDLLPALEEDSIGWPLIHYINEKHNQDRVVGFCDGYNKSKEKYKYTEDDMYMLAAFVTDFIAGRKGDFMTTSPKNVADKFIQSISQPKMPIGFECEMEETYTDAYTEDRVRRFYGKKPITTTTPEAHTQWLGTYIYQ